MHVNSPLRYPGGKSRIANFFRLIITLNELEGGHYAEAYAGGAGVALALLFSDYVAHIHINDLNRAVFAFWHSVLKATEDICRLIWDTPVTMESWYRQRAIQEKPSEHSLVELGFSTFFLNRTNRSGIITGGVIGGKEQAGKWKLDARYNKAELISRIEKVGNYENRITLYNLDAAEFITGIIPNLPPNTLIYLDPPYFIKGHGLYENHYKSMDHESIAQLVATIIQQYWIVSYDNAPEIQKLYEQYRRLVYWLRYSATDRYEGSEVMIFSDDMLVPDIENPTNIKLHQKAGRLIPEIENFHYLV